MRTSSPLGTPVRHALRRLVRALLVAVVTSLVAALLTVAAPASADQGTVDEDGVRRDAPIMPADCFSPGQTDVAPGPCFLTPFVGRQPTLVIWGDSHAYQYVPALRRAVRNQRVNLVSFVAGSCPPLAAPPSARGQGYAGKCGQSNDLALEFVKNRMTKRPPVKVILGSNWSGFRRAYRELYVDRTAEPGEYSSYTKQMVRVSHNGTPRLFKTLRRLGTDISVIGQAATVPVDAPDCVYGYDPYDCDVPRREAIPEEAATARWLRGQLRGFRTPGYLDLTGTYCNPSVCHGVIGGIETWFDRLHLSATRTHTMWEAFRPTVRALRR